MRCAGIDFGISNTDVYLLDQGRRAHLTLAYDGDVSPESVARLLAEAGGVRPRDLDFIAATGGQHRRLPATLDGCPIISVGELEAIGRGGQALATNDMVEAAPDSLLVVSAGSGTAMVLAQGSRYQHITGTGVGGGTMLGLGRLLLNTTDPTEIDALAGAGNANGADLALRDVITGPVGTLPPNATAVNFGRMARSGEAAPSADLAAALVTMIGQVIALLAINAARAAGADAIVVTGHMTDMATLRRAMAAVGNLYKVALLMPPHAGSATALGALLQAGAKHNGA